MFVSTCMESKTEEYIQKINTQKWKCRQGTTIESEIGDKMGK